MAKATADKRASGKRRWGLETDYPFKDSDGVIVLTERRMTSDRRLSNTSFEERLLMFSGLPQRDLDH